MQTIIDQLADHIRARKDTLAALRARIAALLQPIPVGVTLSDDAGPVCRIVRVYTGASQWSDRTWEVTITGTAALTPRGQLLCEQIADRYFDGHNVHHRSSEPTCLSRDGTDALTYAAGKVTRELAARLPAAIARYMAECAAEAEKNTAAAAAL